MGFYQHYILPRIIDVSMRNKETTRLRSTWIPRARDEVLEVGIGSGLNLAFYSSQVERVYGVDPSLELQRMARKRLTGSIPVEFFSQSAEEPLPLADASIDTVVLTWTLLYPGPSESTAADEASSKDGRAAHLPRARSRSRD